MIASEPRRMLMVKLSSIGDVVHVLPVAAALRRRFPDAHLAWAVGPAAADVVIGNPHLDEVLVIGGGAGESGVDALPPLSRPLGLRRALRSRGFDVALDLQGLLKSALIAYLSGAPERFGFRTPREGASLFLNRCVVANRADMHAVDSYLGFAEALGAARDPVDFTIQTSEEDRRTAAELIDGRENLAALLPGARWESKRWPTERFAGAADGLAEEHGLAPLVLGAAGDAPLAAAIAGSSQVQVLDLTGKTTLKQTAEVLRRCRLTIANDTGPMYISAAVGTPTVALFGPSDWRRLGPYGEGHAKLVSGVPCAPCRNRTCRDRVCMEAITVEHVVEAARNLLCAHQEVR